MFYHRQYRSITSLKIWGRLTKMTEIYYQQFQMNPDMLYWLHTSLENGLHTSYPAGASFPKEYDPRKRPWYEQTICE